jgi:hypothetical protein
MANACCVQLLCNMQHEMELALNDVYAKLSAEAERRIAIQRELAAAEVKRVWGYKVADAERGVKAVKEKLAALNKRLSRPPTGTFAKPAKLTTPQHVAMELEDSGGSCMLTCNPPTGALGLCTCEASSATSGHYRSCGSSQCCACRRRRC